MSTETFDFAIVGGGPAGAAMANLLARAGRHVALVDKDSFPRDKVCGEFLSWDAAPLTDLLGVTSVLDARGCPTISTCRIVGRSSSSEFHFPHPARGVSRRLLDATLVEAAASAGATLLTQHSVTALTPAADGYRLTLQPRDDRPEQILAARRVIGAWGRWGRLDRELGRTFVTTRRRHFGFKRHGRATSYGRANDIIELHPFRRGYLGVSSVEEGLANICGLVEQSRISGLRSGWPGFVETLREERASLDSLWSGHEYPESFISSDPVIFAGRETRLGGITFLGDSSGMIDPLTGNGMAMAMQSAALAFCSLMESDGRDWEQRWRRFFAPRIRWSRQSAALLTRPALVDLGVTVGLAGFLARNLASRTRASLQESRRLVDQVARHLAGA